MYSFDKDKERRFGLTRKIVVSIGLIFIALSILSSTMISGDPSDRADSPTIVLSLTIYINGDGYVEYSINGDEFTKYTDPVDLRLGDVVTLKGLSENNRTSVRWSGDVTSNGSEVVIDDVRHSLDVNVDFYEHEGMDATIIALAAFTAIMASIATYFLIKRR